jgi:hypothetical protein
MGQIWLENNSKNGLRISRRTLEGSRTTETPLLLPGQFYHQQYR